MPAVGLTDHGTMFGVIEFYNAAIKAGVKPIIGVESYMATRRMQDRDPHYDKKRHHLLLLAENETGYKNLLKIASASQLEGFYYKPRIDHEFLAAHAEGLICTTGCMAAEIPQALLNNNLEEARRKFDYYYEVFGPDHFFIELQDHDIPELPGINKELIDFKKHYNVQFIATNDVHYVDKDDFRLQDILLAIQTGRLISDPNRLRMTDPSYHLRSPAEMEALFGHIPGALSNTLAIAERCNLDLSFKGYHLPEFDVPEGFTTQSYLRALCEEGLRQRYGDAADSETVPNRLDYELKVIHDMGFDAYFLIVWDLCQYAQREDIWYNVRGSAAGSIVAFCLEITMVDPIERGLIFERFLNPNRISMPDIDLDFPDDMRAKMMEYCANRYGHDKVAQIITFGTLKARAAVRDVGRVMDIPLKEVDRVAKLIPAIPGKPITIEEAIEQVPDLRKVYESTDYVHELLDTAKEMEGVVRNVGTHAAGVIVTDKPVIEYVPLHRSTSKVEDLPIKTVTQFEMGVIDALGLLKVDFLGLTTLTVMARACNFIHERHGVDLNLDNIPLDDPKCFELMGRGDTAGVFQVEGAGMRNYLIQMKPQNLDNVVAMIALFRPGPMDFIPSYIKRMHGEEEVSYRHLALKPVLEETYGIPVYQEQLMRAAVELAGYTASESDDLRKAIAKKIKKKLMKHREKFVKGANERNIPEETANQIFSDWEEFARYGFNKCLPGETEVIDASSGRLVKLEDLYSKSTQIKQTVVCDMERLKVRPHRVTAVLDNGVKPVFQLTTMLGRRIEATSNHPFYTFDGWQRLDKLQVGDLIAVPRRLPVEGKTQWPDHKVIVLGHLLAEGNLCHPHSVHLYSKDNEYLDDYIKAVEQFENVTCSINLHKGTHAVYAKRIRRNQELGVVPWAKKMGIWGKKAPEKEIPAAAFELNNRQIALLLSRLWVGDGHLSKYNGYAHIYYSTSSECLARQVQHLLLRLGIVSRLRTVNFPYKDGCIGYQIHILGLNNIKNFAATVGSNLINQQHRQLIASVLAADYGTARVPRAVIPDQVKEIVRSEKEAPGIHWRQLNLETGVGIQEFLPSGSPTKRGYRREAISHLADHFNSPKLSGYARSDIYWDEIVSLEYVGGKQTYDLTIPEFHNFVANDIIVHNSHATDYGIIAVQTAYLKANYPVEYMTALLSSWKNNTDAIARYVADCRRMGLEILPPNVEKSGWDFTIEDRPDGSFAIRLGLGAVKNVGYGPIKIILQARVEGSFDDDQDRPFEDLNDFARRVDLRLVGKRPLECLIRVGALDSFGPRVALLQVLDRIVAISASHFRAAEAGQLSLFGPQTGLVTQITLPEPSEIDQRELLNWERELIGLFVSDHPLNPYMETLNQAVSYFSSDLSKANEREKVRVAGILTRLRRIVTKTGKPMVFATIEDIQGSIELVVFPNAWRKYQELLELDNVLLVEGSVDSQGVEPKILVDKITTEFRNVVPLAQPSATSPPQPHPQEKTNGTQGRLQTPVVDPNTTPDPDLPPPRQVTKDAEPNHTPENPLTLPARGFEGPPPPDPFPPDWDDQANLPSDPDDSKDVGLSQGVPIPNLDPVAVAIQSPTDHDQPEPSAEPQIETILVEEPELATPEEIPKEVVTSGPQNLLVDEVSKQPDYISPPQSTQDDSQRQMLTIILRANSDQLRDALKIQRIYGVLISYPGNDRFAFYMFEGSKSFLVEFPNFTTGICDELITRLQETVGPENIRTEPIIYQ